MIIRKFILSVTMLFCMISFSKIARAGNILDEVFVNSHHITYYCNGKTFDFEGDWTKIPTGLTADWVDDLAEFFFHLPDGSFEECRKAKAPFDAGMAIMIFAGILAAIKWKITT